MIEPNHFGIPPWKERDHWSQAVHSLKYAGARRRRRLMQAEKFADQIERKLRTVDSALETLCNATCESCIDICCKKATVWYDFKDLLYLYFSTGRLPDGQIHKKPDQTCCHLTPAGCYLSRSVRPFICTWYLCPDQAFLCAGQRPGGLNCIQASIQEIQGLRKQLESEFIKAVR